MIDWWYMQLYVPKHRFSKTMSWLTKRTKGMHSFGRSCNALLPSTRIWSGCSSLSSRNLRYTCRKRSAPSSSSHFILIFWKLAMRKRPPTKKQIWTSIFGAKLSTDSSLLGSGGGGDREVFDDTSTSTSTSFRRPCAACRYWSFSCSNTWAKEPSRIKKRSNLTQIQSSRCSLWRDCCHALVIRIVSFGDAVWLDSEWKLFCPWRHSEQESSARQHEGGFGICRIQVCRWRQWIWQRYRWKKLRRFGRRRIVVCRRSETTQEVSRVGDERKSCQKCCKITWEDETGLS